MIIYITQFLTRMLHSARANKTALITVNPRGNLHFIRWKRFEIVCCRRLKRGEIERKRLRLESEMRFMIFLLIHRIATVCTAL